MSREREATRKSPSKSPLLASEGVGLCLLRSSHRRREEVGFPILCFCRVDRVGVVPIGVDLEKVSAPTWENKYVALLPLAGAGGAGRQAAFSSRRSADRVVVLVLVSFPSSSLLRWRVPHRQRGGWVLVCLWG